MFGELLFLLSIVMPCISMGIPVRFLFSFNNVETGFHDGALSDELLQQREVLDVFSKVFLTNRV